MGTQKTSADSPLDRPAIPMQLPESSKRWPKPTPFELASLLRADGPSAHGLPAPAFRLLWVTLSVLSTRRLVLPLPESLPA